MPPSNCVVGRFAPIAPSARHAATVASGLGHVTSESETERRSRPIQRRRCLYSGLGVLGMFHLNQHLRKRDDVILAGNLWEFAGIYACIGL